MERVFDKLDGYSPVDGYPNVSVKAGEEAKNSDGPWGNIEGLVSALRLDGFQNHLTGVGDPSRDKSLGGHFNGPRFVNQFLTGWEAQERHRGSALGGRIIETIPREMVRKGWKISIQPEPKTKKRAGPRTDDFPGAAPKAPTHEPEEISAESDDNTALVEALRLEQERLGFASALELGLVYERNFGGAGVFLGVDDGATDLTTPLDWSKVKRIKHLTAFRGGWDGELIAYAYYVDPTAPNFGKPRVYQLRNLSVTVGMQAPGEKPDPGLVNAQSGALLTYVHESRLLIFDGDPKSRTAQVQMRGWGDGIWMRINEVLAQYSLSWNGVAILMQELGTPILTMEGFSKFMAAKDGEGLAIVTARSVAMQLAMSIAKVRVIDTTEKIERLATPLAGIADVLREFALQLCAAASTPFSKLFGQVQGGLGDASKGDISFFDDEIVGLEAAKLTPKLRTFVALQFACTEGVAKGKTPARWSVAPNPQREMTPQAKADYRYKIAQADASDITSGIVTPEEVAATRYGTSEYNDGPIVLDFEERKAAKAAALEAPTAPAQEPDDKGAGLTTMEPASSLAAPVKHDAADFVRKNGRTKVATACSVVVPFGPDGKALMGVRADSGKLCFPGGHAEPGEDPLSTAIRELHEETGLHPKRIALVGRKALPGNLSTTIISVYRALVDGDPTGANDPDKEFSSFRWVNLSSGDYPDDVELHHEKDVVGPMLRRRA